MNLNLADLALTAAPPLLALGNLPTVSEVDLASIQVLVSQSDLHSVLLRLPDHVSHGCSWLWIRWARSVTFVFRVTEASTWPIFEK